MFARQRNRESLEVLQSRRDRREALSLMEPSNLLTSQSPLREVTSPVFKTQRVEMLPDSKEFAREVLKGQVPGRRVPAECTR